VKLYFAARYSRRQEMLLSASQLAGLGITVTSRWILGGHQIDDTDSLGDKAAEDQKSLFAKDDLEDIREADALVAFSEEPRKTNSRGGRHVEFGIAIGLGKPVFVVGYRENIFHCLAGVDFFRTWTEFLHHIANAHSLKEDLAPFNHNAVHAGDPDWKAPDHVWPETDSVP
jgi:nucleoside 2-deoxyribosyltransferase